MAPKSKPVISSGAQPKKTSLMPKKTLTFPLNERWSVGLQGETLLWDFQVEFWSLSIFILHADFRG